MTDVDALLQIASAIRGLASSIGGLSFILVLFLFFKNMGGVKSTSNESSKSVTNSFDEDSRFKNNP